MSRLLTIVGLTAAVCVGSCAHRGQIGAEPMTWALHETTEEGMKLTYGVPASDNVVLMMTCHPGSKSVRLSTLAAGEPRIVLKSGKGQDSFPAVAPADPAYGQILEATAAPSAPSLAAFARTGDITLVERGRVVKMKASGAEKTQVTQFFQTCSA